MPHDIDRFVLEHIGSIHELEILLLIYESRPRGWRASDVARHLRLDARAVSSRLDSLAARGLVARGEEGFSHAASAQLDRVMDHLASAYAERPLAVIELIFSEPRARDEGVPEP